jgi:hypothetical protein
MTQLEFDFPTPLDQLTTELIEIDASITTNRIYQLNNIAVPPNVGTTTYIPHTPY